MATDVKETVEIHRPFQNHDRRKKKKKDTDKHQKMCDVHVAGTRNRNTRIRMLKSALKKKRLLGCGPHVIVPQARGEL